MDVKKLVDPQDPPWGKEGALTEEIKAGFMKEVALS